MFGELTIVGAGSDIAIVGMAGCFPDAADIGKFWQLQEKVS